MTETKTTGPVLTRSYVQTSHMNHEMYDMHTGKVYVHRWQHVVSGYHYVTEYGTEGQSYGNLGTTVVQHGTELQAKVAWWKLYKKYN